jgi:hypothetical protein
MLDARCSMLDARCSMLDARCSMLDARCSMLGARCSMLDARCSMLDARCSMLDARCSMLDVGSLMRRWITAGALILLVATVYFVGWRAERQANLWLNGSPGPEAVTFDVGVFGCGNDPSVTSVSVEETDDAVIVSVLIREPRSFRCGGPSSPGTPLTIRLEQPLGDRAVLQPRPDASMEPIRPNPFEEAGISP